MVAFPFGLALPRPKVKEPAAEGTGFRRLAWEDSVFQLASERGLPLLDEGARLSPPSDGKEKLGRLELRCSLPFERAEAGGMAPGSR